MAKMKLNRTMIGKLIYLPLDVEIKAVVLEEVKTYFLHRQNTVNQYIVTWTILDLCLEA